MDNSGRAAPLRVSSVLLAIHAAVVLILVATFVVMLRGPQVDANIGAGLMMLLLLPLGVPWSFAFFLPGVSGHQADLIIAAAAIVNLVLHALVVYLVRSHRESVSRTSMHL